MGPSDRNKEWPGRWGLIPDSNKRRPGAAKGHSAEARKTVSARGSRRKSIRSAGPRDVPSKLIPRPDTFLALSSSEGNRGNGYSFTISSFFSTAERFMAPKVNVAMRPSLSMKKVEGKT